MIIIVAIFVVLVIIIGSISSAIQNNSTSAQATSTADAQQTACCVAPTLAPTDIPTQAPTIAPTAKPQPVALGKQAVIGNTVAAFNAKYGNPTSHSSNGDGSITYSYGAVAKDIGQISVVTFPNSQRIFGIILAPSGSSWDAVTAYTTCLTFDPEDSTVGTGHSVQDLTGTDVGLFQDGKSTELANSLPANDFINQDSSSSVPPGTFSLLFSYVAGSNGTQADACSTVVGEESTSSLTQN